MDVAPTVSLSNARPSRLMRLATFAAMSAATLMVLVKTFAYFNSHSVALLSSLADSALDLMASTVNMIAVRSSLVPADDQQIGRAHV